MNGSPIIRVSRSALMFGGFTILLNEIRFEHRTVLLDDWRPWIPLLLCSLMLVAIPLGTYLWERGGRNALLSLYVLTSGTGLLGVLFHSNGHLVQRLHEFFFVWTNSLQTGSLLKENHPPLLAPAAFIGLGLIGALFTLEPATAQSCGARNKL